jgi:hypothetical protein
MEDAMFGRYFLVLAVAVSAAVMGGCKGGTTFIDHVAFKPSDNLETIKLSLVFGNAVKADLAGGFMIKDYGFLFINPYTQSEPFEIGFSLNTAIANDQEYVNIEPTAVLPNGMPIGIDHVMVEVRAKQPISSKFDLYGYVDVRDQSWLGTAAIFGFINDQYFPNDLSLNQAFLRNKDGKPGVLASVFGPTMNPDGTLRRAGGISIMANVRQLIEGRVIGPNATRETIAYAEGLPVAMGRRAAEYQGNVKAMMKLEQNLVRAFNQK